MTTETNIFTAMLEVYKSTGYVQKTGKVAFGTTKYNYAGEADLIAALRPALIENGIICYPLSAKVQSFERNIVTAEYVFRFYHAPSNTFIDVEAIGQGADTQDKAAYKAATGAIKYALRQSFIIETGDDPDKDSSDKITYDTAAARNRRHEKIKKELESAKGMKELQEAWTQNHEHIIAIKASGGEDGETFYNDLVQAKDKRKLELTQKKAVEAGYPQEFNKIGEGNEL